jgi:hypothetical protein
MHSKSEEEMTENTFFVSEGLTGRISEDVLESQSREFDYGLPGRGLVESTVHFEHDKMICSVSNIVILKSIESITFLASVNIWSMIEKFTKKATITKVTINDETGAEISGFDMKEKSYKVIITKCKDDINYELQLIFI